MPWKVTKKGDKYCVVRSDTGKQVACHDSEAKAERQMRALYASEKKEKSVDAEKMALQLARMKTNTPVTASETVSATQPIHIHIHNDNATFDTSPVPSAPPAPTPTTVEFSPIRLYFREGEKTPDGRILDPNCVNFDRPPPFSIRLQTTQPEGGGHAGAVVCGVITKIMRDGLAIVCDGFLDLTTSAGREAHNLITNRTMQTWSPDLGDAVVDYEQNVSDEDVDEATGVDQLAHFVKATFLGATLVAMPALASAVVELLDAEGNTIVAPPERGLTPSAPPTTGLLRYITDRSDNITTEIAACAGPAAPDPAFFTNPNLTELQRFTTITPDGRIFGHSAGRDECHIGFRNQCVTIDHIADCRGEGNFEYATPGYVICSDGSKVRTGPICIKGGHAPSGLPWQETLSHYDDPSAAVADVVYGMDEWGIWFSGAVRPTATSDQIRTLLASGVSLDAREIDGKLRYLTTTCVNSPGYPKMRARFVASSETAPPRVTELISPGSPPESNECDCVPV